MLQNSARSIKNRSICCLLALAFISCVALFVMKAYQFFKYGGRTVTIEMKTSVPGIGKIYFDSGRGYNEGETQSFSIRFQPTTEFVQHVISIPKIVIRDMRFDPIDTRSSLEIRKVVITTRDETISIEGEALARRIIPLNQITVLEVNPYISVITTGQDPHFSVEGLSCPTNRYAFIRTLVACSILALTIILPIYLTIAMSGWLRLNRPKIDDIISRRRLIMLFIAFLISLSVMLIVHKGAWAEYLRYSRVAEGWISQAVQSILASGGKSLQDVAIGDAHEWGRIRPAHWINYVPPYIATMVRNGDLFHHDTSYIWYNRINGDLQTHTLFLLVLFSLAVAFGMMWIYHTSGSLFATLLFPILASSSLTVCDNLLVGYADSQDIPQLFWIMLYLFLIMEILWNQHSAVNEVFSYIALVFAYFTKETSIVLGPAIGFFLGVNLYFDSYSRRRFIFRQVSVHIVLSIVLVSLVLTNMSGHYVAENLAVDQQGLHARLLFAWQSLKQGLFSPVLFCSGVFIFIIYTLMCYLRKKDSNENSASWLDISLSLLIFAGFFVVALQWKGLAWKYYLIVMFFGSLGTCMLLGLFIHRLRFLRKQLTCWILIVGSITILFRPAGEVYQKIQSFYLDAYGYRRSVPLVAKDIARIALERQSSVLSAHLVLNELFQEGELPFLRHINKIEELNLVMQGKPIQKISAIERNYFRIFPEHNAVEISSSTGANLLLKADLVYVIARETLPDVEKLRQWGYTLEKCWDMGAGYGEVYRFEPAQISGR